MGRQNYTKVGRKWRRMRGFRLNCGRFSVHRLSCHLFAIFGLFDRCFKLLRKKSSSHSRWQKKNTLSSSRRGLMFEGRYVSMRSNSFYAEAIADCLEFIKRNSVSAETGED